MAYYNNYAYAQALEFMLVCLIYISSRSLMDVHFLDWIDSVGLLSPHLNGKKSALRDKRKHALSTLNNIGSPKIKCEISRKHQNWRKKRPISNNNESRCRTVASCVPFGSHELLLNLVNVPQLVWCCVRFPGMVPPSQSQFITSNIWCVRAIGEDFFLREHWPAEYTEPSRTIRSCLVWRKKREARNCDNFLFHYLRWSVRS